LISHLNGVFKLLAVLLCLFVLQFSCQEDAYNIFILQQSSLET